MIASAKNKRKEERSVCVDILRYGSDILQSDIFRQAEEEMHHLHGSVSDHTLTVCIVAVRLCHYLERRKIRIRKKEVIRAALCHDLGMIGRDTKYKNRKTAWVRHPDESVRIAHALLPENDDSVDKMIRTHMWPVAGARPKVREEGLLNVADKIASIADWASWLIGHPYAKRIKRTLASANASHQPFSHP